MHFLLFLLLVVVNELNDTTPRSCCLNTAVLIKLGRSVADSKTVFCLRSVTRFSFLSFPFSFQLLMSNVINRQFAVGGSGGGAGKWKEQMQIHPFFFSIINVSSTGLQWG